MSLVLTVPPTVEPVDPSEARDFLRLDHDLEYIQIARALVAARQMVEQRAGIGRATGRGSLMLGA